MARQEGLEPPTSGLEGPCSIQLSYCRHGWKLGILASCGKSAKPAAEPAGKLGSKSLHARLQPVVLRFGRNVTFFESTLAPLVHAST